MPNKFALQRAMFLTSMHVDKKDAVGERFPSDHMSLPQRRCVKSGQVKWQKEKQKKSVTQPTSLIVCANWQSATSS